MRRQHNVIIGGARTDSAVSLAFQRCILHIEEVNPTCSACSLLLLIERRARFRNHVSLTAAPLGAAHRRLHLIRLPKANNRRTALSRSGAENNYAHRNLRNPGKVAVAPSADQDRTPSCNSDMAAPSGWSHPRGVTQDRHRPHRLTIGEAEDSGRVSLP